ncbi:MAG: hypothetical protein NTZ05_08275 [Chloroflexi bacterium]|nr:hypothetical protein [Chloroflexota bacterium]
MIWPVFGRPDKQLSIAWPKSQCTNALLLSNICCSLPFTSAHVASIRNDGYVWGAEMTSSSKRIEIREQAKTRLDQIFRQPNLVNIIHYSCESFYDRPNGASPRITSIAVRNLGSGQTTSFSVHQRAEFEHIPFSEITVHYDRLEKKMLDEFYKYVGQNKNYTWIHWNMRDMNFGFPALEHRHRVLSGKPITIPDNKLFDLAVCLVEIHGPRYTKHPHLKSIMDLNGISALQFLSGKEEAAAFDAGEYVKLHQSTLRKVDIIAHIAERQWNGTLVTAAPFRDRYGASISGMIDLLNDHPVVKVLTFISVIVTLITIVPLFSAK